MKGFLQIFSFVAFVLFLGSCEANSLSGDAGSGGKALSLANTPVVKGFDGHVITVFPSFGAPSPAIQDTYFFGWNGFGVVQYIRDQYSTVTDYEQLVAGSFASGKLGFS